MQSGHVHVACPCLSCMPLSMLHDHVHAACPCPGCISICHVRVQGHVHAHVLSIVRVYDHVHASCPCPCFLSMSMSILHVRDHACPYLCMYMFMSMPLAHVHAACLCPCSCCMSLLSLLTVYAACPCPHCCSFPWTRTWNTDMDKRQGIGHGHEHATF
jgi:hypothetical protein